MNKKKSLIAVLALALCIGIAFAGYFVISNKLEFSTRYNYDTPIRLTLIGTIPENVNYTNAPFKFNVTTENVDGDGKRFNCTTYIEIYVSDEELTADMITVTYTDDYWSGELLFVEEDDGSLLCTSLGGGSWICEPAYFSNAEITVEFHTNAPNGEYKADVWVEGVEAPLP